MRGGSGGELESLRGTREKNGSEYGDDAWALGRRVSARSVVARALERESVESSTGVIL